jgi:hypothetical protein
MNCIGVSIEREYFDSEICGYAVDELKVNKYFYFDRKRKSECWRTNICLHGYTISEATVELYKELKLDPNSSSSMKPFTSIGESKQRCHFCANAMHRKKRLITKGKEDTAPDLINKPPESEVHKCLQSVTQTFQESLASIITADGRSSPVDKKDLLAETKKQLGVLGHAVRKAGNHIQPCYHEYLNNYISICDGEGTNDSCLGFAMGQRANKITCTPCLTHQKNRNKRDGRKRVQALELSPNTRSQKLKTTRRDYMVEEQKEERHQGLQREYRNVRRTHQRLVQRWDDLLESSKCEQTFIETDQANIKTVLDSITQQPTSSEDAI